MHPELYRFFASHTLSLGNLIFMMGEDQVDTASVNVELLAQVFGGHGGAFDVPAGKAYTPGAGPVHLPACIPMLPQGEVFWRFFIFGDFQLHAATSTCA